MIVIKNNIISFNGYKAINLFGVLFVRKDARVDDELLNHERIHTAQMKEMLFIFFYVWYGLEYIAIRFFHKKQGDAYHDVSLEEEAHLNDKNLNYLNERKHFAWWKFVRARSWKE